MKVLHCIPRLAGGGAERQLFYLVRELDRRGHPQHLVFFRPGPDPPPFPPNVIIHRLEAAGNYDPRLVGRMIRLMRRVRPDVVQSWILQMDVVAGMAARFLSLPWVLREPSSHMAWPRTLKNFLRFWLARGARGVVCNSQEGLDLWSRQRGPNRRVMIPNIVPLEEINRLPPTSLETFGISPQERVILFAGRFDQWAKNVTTLVAALIEVMSSQPCYALLCGDGAGVDEARQLARQGGQEKRILFPGYVDPVVGLMKRADLFVSVSIFEGQPNVVLEAMACKCPLVLSDIPAHRALVDEAAAWFAPAREPHKIAQAILQALADPRQAQLKADAAFNKLDGFRPDSVADKYLQFYQELVPLP
ncbi:MAG: glycosyltransferase family 4 protein [Nitrospinaceae bacterium]